MKTKSIDIDGKTFVVREISMEDGMPLINPDSGRMDIPGLIRAATTIDGQPAQPGEISMSVGMRLMPIVMELNAFGGGEAGNA